MVKRKRKLSVPTPAVFILSLAVSAWAADGFRGDHRDAWGPRFEGGHDAPRHRATRRGDESTNWVRRWNEIALDANALDHTPVAPGESRVFGEQLGPGRTSRAFAIVQIAVFDAVNAIAGGYKSYTGLRPALDGTSMKAAIAQAAHDALVALYPSQTENFDDLLAEDLHRIRDGREKRNGIHLGHEAATAILELRANDGSEHDEPQVGVDYITSNEPGRWRQDPVSEIPLALGARWREVRPLVLTSAGQFRAPPPPALNDPEYT
ncbi:MAG: vanadium-dependent haloperoxidase, partial [Candidatus Methylomirabilaceae bacterium]